MSVNDADGTAAASGSVIRRVIGWLSAGYPEGIPATDRFAVVAVLKRRLNDDQVRQIARQLSNISAAEGAIEQEEIEDLIRRELQETPSDNDIRRVSAQLAAGGWPLAGELDDEDQLALASNEDRSA